MTHSLPTNAKAIQQLHQDQQVNPHVLQLLWQGINSMHNQYPIDEQYDTIPESTQLHRLHTLLVQTYEFLRTNFSNFTTDHGDFGG